MIYYQPYMPLYISGDDAGNARRQQEADHINRTTNRFVNTCDVMACFAALMCDYDPLVRCDA